MLVAEAPNIIFVIHKFETVINNLWMAVLAFHAKLERQALYCTRLIGSPKCAGNAKLLDILMQSIDFDTHMVSLIVAKRQILERTVFSWNWVRLGFSDINGHIRPCLFVSKFMQLVTYHHFPNAGRVRVSPSKIVSSDT